MKYFTKIASLMLVLTLSVIAFAACGKKEETPETPETPVVTPESLVKETLTFSNFAGNNVNPGDDAVLTEINAEKVTFTAAEGDTKAKFTVEIAGNVNFIDVKISKSFLESNNMIGNDFKWSRQLGVETAVDGFAYVVASEADAATKTWKKYGTDEEGVVATAIEPASLYIEGDTFYFYTYTAAGTNIAGTIFTVKLEGQGGTDFEFQIEYKAPASVVTE